MRTLHPTVAARTALAMLLSSISFGQGWEEITPEGLSTIHHFQSFDINDSSFEVYAWNTAGVNSKGFRLNQSGEWDSIAAGFSYTCYPPEPAANILVSIGVSREGGQSYCLYLNGGGCSVECFTFVYTDSSGGYLNQQQLFSFDDFTCAGFSSAIAVSPDNENEIYIAFFDSLYRSSDGGNSFEALSSPLPGLFEPLLDGLWISPHTPGLLFVSGSDLYRSSDSGFTWSSVLENAGTIEFSHFETSAIYATADSGFFKSSNEGETWTRLADISFSTIEVDKNNPGIIYAGNASGKIFHSVDSGMSWQIYNDTFTSLPILGIHHISGTDTLIVGAIDGLFNVYDSYVLTVDDPAQEPPNGFSLSQNYPNPFNPSTTIQFSVPSQGRGGVRSVTLKVYDILGREVATVVNEKLGPGTHTRQWDARLTGGQASGMASGVYFYRLKSGGFTESKRLVLLR